MKAWILLVAVSLAPVVIYGQTTFKTTAGGDQIYGAYGLQTDFKYHKLSGWTGLGYSDGIRYGAYLEVPVKTNESGTGNYLGLGDQRLNAYLDTDEYDSHSFTVRGAGYILRTPTSSTQVFAGLLSQEMYLPYMRTSATNGNVLQTSPLGAVMYQHQLSRTLQLHSMNLYGNKLTAIGSIGWTPSRQWKFAVANGVGFGSKFVAGSGGFYQKHLEANASYTVVGKGFQRQEQPYYSTELVGLNARLSLSPIQAIKLVLAHERSRTNIVGFPSVTGTFDSAALATKLKGLQISPSVSLVKLDSIPGTTLTTMISGSKALSSRWTTFGAYIHGESPSSEQQTFIADNEFQVNSRLSIHQNYNRLDGQNNYSFGGQWISNLISLSADQQIYISPIAQAFGGKSVFQAWTFNIRVRTPHGTNATVNTMVTPDGKVQWGGYLSGMRYDSVGLDHSNVGPVFSKYTIRGTVLDQKGNGVEGIAVMIGKDTVMSDEAGVFYLDVKNAKPMTVTVAKDSSVQPLYWHLTSAPSLAQGQLESALKEPVQITVSTVRCLLPTNN